MKIQARSSTGVRSGPRFDCIRHTIARRWPGALAVSAILCLAFAASPVLANPPEHPPNSALDISGFNHACGAAVDSKGDIYVASAGTATIDVFDPEHQHLTSISNANEPCGLAVDSKGRLYVSEAGTGKVVRYVPNNYPFIGTLTYGAPATIDPSGEAKGIAVDPFDDRLYVAEGNRIDVYEPDGSFSAVSEVQEVFFFSPTGGTFRLAMPAEGGSGRNEIQWVRRANDAKGSGTFTLGFEGQTTGAIPQEATASEVKAALQSLSTIGPGNVSVTGFPGVRGYWVKFIGSLAETDISLIKADGEALEDANKTILVGAFSDISSPIPLGATAGEVESQLEGLDSIGAGNVEVEKPGSNYLVTFTGALASTNVGLLAGDGTGLENGNWRRVEVSTITDGFNGHIGEGDLTEATGVAAYTYPTINNRLDRYVFAADAATDQVEVFDGTDIRALKVRKIIKGPKSGEDFGFGVAGAYLAVDPGVGNPTPLKCSEQACTAGHFLVYDEAHKAIDEFDATGEYLDQFTNAAFADAQPTALAVERSGGPNDGTIYVTAGPGLGGKLLAFDPLAAPSRPPLPEPLSHVLAGAKAVETDSFGNVYIAAETTIYVYGPAGNELTKFEDPRKAYDLGVDSKGNLYVLDGKLHEEQMTYYTPAAYPPVKGTGYIRHEPPLLPSQSALQGIGVNPANDHVFVVRSIPARITEFGSAQEESPIPNPTFASALIADAAPRDVAVYGANGSVYFAANSRLDVIDSTGTEFLGRITGAGGPNGPFGPNPGIAVDQSNGHVLVFQPGQSVREYDASGAFVAEYGKSTALAKGYNIATDSACALHEPPLTETTSPTCKEFDPANGNVYVAFDDTAPETFDLTAFGPLTYGEVPVAVTGGASGLGAGAATLHGTVDPRGFDLTDCHFEYLTDAQYITNGKTFTGAIPKPCAESLAAIGKGTGPVSVHTDLSNLVPDTRYRYRLVAANKYGSSPPGDPGLFGPPVLTTKTALPVLYDEATLRAEIDPSGLATTYHFQYVDDATFQADQPNGFANAVSTPDAQIPAGDGSVDVQVPLFGLADGATYHFRLVAENEAKTVQGPDQTLTTLERAASQNCPNTEYRIGLSANLPDCRAYEMVTPAETRGAAPEAGTANSSGREFNHWLIVPRGPGAGESLSYGTRVTLPGFDGNGIQDGYRAQRGEGEHPAEGWTSMLLSPSFAQAGGGAPGEQGIASDQLYSVWETDPEETFEGTLPKGTFLRAPFGFEVLGRGSLGTDSEAESRFVSAGGTHVIFFSGKHLEPAAPPEPTVAVYDRAAGASSAKVISVKPDGSAFGAAENATYIGATEDGSAILFKVGTKLYLHRAGGTIGIAEGENTFAGISEDGKRVFYTNVDNGSAQGKLFACDVQPGPCAGSGAHAPTEIASSSIFVNVSAAGSRVFFTSEGVLAGAEPNEHGETAESGKPNLYAWDGVGTRFVAILDPQDLVSYDGNPSVSLLKWTNAIGTGLGTARALSPTRSTPDGKVFVFQSHAQLTPYENKGLSEVYRYDPAAALGERLTCPSCDPTGALPVADATLQSIGNGPAPAGFSALIPNITDDGLELFFQSSDRLLPEDANSVQDVYEWKTKGAGEGAAECKRDGGCLALISSGQGEEENALFSMTPDGHDVFFETLEKLVGADVTGSPTIYDARVEGGIPDPPPSTPCQGDACQGQGSTPPALPTPTSSGGNGNFEESGSACRKGKHRVKGRCVKKHHKRKHHHHRANHNRRAGK